VKEPGIQVVGLGMATLDVLMRREGSEAAAGATKLLDFGLDAGGPVATAVSAAARLGVGAALIATAGSDAAGELKCSLLARGGVDLSRIIRRPGGETQVSLVWIDGQTGERTFSVHPRFGAGQIVPDELDRDFITSAQWLHLDGSHAAAALQAAQWMREAGKRVIIDAAETRTPVGESMRALCRRADVLVCGTGFAESLTGRSDTWEALRAARAMGPEVVVETAGGCGSYTAAPGEEFHTPAFDVEVVDTTGAGDVFHGAYIVGLLRGWPAQAIATFASAAAAIACTRLGGQAGLSTFDDVVAFCRSRERDLPRQGTAKR